MIKYLKYLRYVIRHKWYVLIECWGYGRFWQGITHDWSKFLPSEWFPYARYFYEEYPNAPEIYHQQPGYTGLTRQNVESQFDVAWLHHIHHNAHHWQHWVLIQDEDDDKVLPIPRKYLIEMLCDWKGAGKAQGTPDTIAWYEKHKEKMIMNEHSRRMLENMLYEKTQTVERKNLGR
ncbi:MAG: hypothetical protein H8D67_18885 [Deltaproteobacteria bacterium]|nr:hypothetical protein [Deltaproteobacteria bacterium]